MPIVELAELCQKYGIAELSVFGSVARGDARPDSDIDLLYVRVPGNDLGMSLARSRARSASAAGWSTAFLACHAARMSSGGASGSTPSTSYHVIPLIIGHR